MLKDVQWSEDGTYTPQGLHKPLEFFSEGLKNSIRFDLELGYFNSAAINVLAPSFATFIKNGGRMRMAINNIVSQRDKTAIEDGKNGNIDAPFDLTDWQSIHEALDDYGDHFFRCLAFLIQEERIEIRIIKPRGTNGISHSKKGFFEDGEMAVSFNGSANFTLGGLFNNRENISIVFNTSPDSMIRNMVENRKKEFDNIMNGSSNEVDYLSPADLEAAIRSEYGSPELEDLLDVEDKLRRFRKENNAIQEIQDKQNPKFPFSTGPRDYQQKAFENWLANGQKGLFAMATGTGKTITSLNVLLEIYKRKGYYKAIILVPTITLVNQWEEECRKFNFSRIIKVNSKNTKWREEINRLKFDERYCKSGENISFVIVSTYTTFCRSNAFEVLNSFSKNQTLLIADEAHNMGARGILKRLKDIVYLRRIGLSATPERQFDDKTNERLLRFFGAQGGYTYEYSMAEAIKNNVLCRYFYYPHIVELTNDEMEQYIELSVKIAHYFNISTGSFEHEDDVLKALLLARKRIIHKAENKLCVFKDVIQKRYEDKRSLMYTLVYVPEGNKTDTEFSDVFDTEDFVSEDEDTIHLIDAYTKIVSDVDKFVTVKKFTSDSADRDKTLADFADGKLQVLTSMKCLDEGVDVPQSELAIFCASTGNPRQFVQRRGRILRTHKNKQYAYIHDLVVIPKILDTCPSYRMEQKLLKKELERVSNFALLSENPSDTQIELNEVMTYYGLNLYNNNHIL